MVYVDNFMAPFRGMKMSHMAADTLDELHAMAETLGLKREWFQEKSTPHYDICAAKRELAIREGAIALTPRHLVMMMTHVKRYGVKKCPVCIDNAKIQQNGPGVIICENCGWNSTDWDKNCFEKYEIVIKVGD